MAEHANSISAPEVEAFPPPLALSRRHLFGAAAVMVAGLPAAAQADDAAQFQSWARQAQQAWAKANAPSATETQTRHWCFKANDLDGLIIETPARSREAMLIKLETLERIAVEMGDDEYASGFAQARAFIRGAN